jgi:SAM-dependent methyltransferase
MPVHDVAARGFGSAADEYERYRPSYPADAVAWLGEQCAVGPSSTVCDLGAGTGKLTRLLLPSGARVIAAEPLPAMVTVLHRELPNVPTTVAVAEDLPFADGTFTAVTAAQAFHWFDLERVLPELHRVLAPRGRVGVLWNGFDDTVEWVAALRDLVARSGASAEWLKGHLDDRWLFDAITASPYFGDLHSAAFRHEQRATPDAVVERIATSSHIVVKEAPERDAVLDEARAILDRAGFVGSSEISFPYRVDAYWCERLA